LFLNSGSDLNTSLITVTVTGPDPFAFNILSPSVPADKLTLAAANDNASCICSLDLLPEM
jgi:hypothetical protein